MIVYVPAEIRKQDTHLWYGERIRTVSWENEIQFIPHLSDHNLYHKSRERTQGEKLL